MRDVGQVKMVWLTRRRLRLSFHGSLLRVSDPSKVGSRQEKVELNDVVVKCVAFVGRQGVKTVEYDDVDACIWFSRVS